ncbi:hypothetical protein GCM10020331_023510 [Ectobacillus funiculus]
MESIMIHKKNVYHISCVPFEDKSEQDKDGNYEYYYKGRNISFCRDKEWIEGRMYDEEGIISFFQNPILAFWWGLRSNQSVSRQRIWNKEI